MSILIALVIFGIIVLVHEFGHFYAARKNGVCVEEFAIGMGPKLVGIQRGETLYTIRLLPLGGFCKMLGDDSENSSDRAFGNKKVWQRIIIIIAGVVMNISLAFVIQFFISAVEPAATTTIGAVIKDSPAEQIGLTKGDVIEKFNNTNIHIFTDLFLAVYDSKGAESIITYRDSTGETFTKTITPMKVDGGFLIGIQPITKKSYFSTALREDYKNLEPLTFSEYVKTSTSQVYWYLKYILFSVKKLVTLDFSMNELSGPIGIVQSIGETYTEKKKDGVLVTVLALSQLTVILSTSLAVFNLLPLPALDGGRLVFLIVEGLRGKPVNPEKEGMVHLIGFALLMVFALFVAYHDIIKLITPK